MGFIEAQASLVREVAASADVGPWMHLFAQVEILEHADDYQLDHVCLAVVDSAGELEIQQFQLSGSAREAAIAIYRQRKDEAAEMIGGFELTIERDGTYHLVLDHEPPRRINGLWDEEREGRIDTYLDIYKAGIAQTR